MEQSSEIVDQNESRWLATPKGSKGDRNKRVHGIRPLTFVGWSLFLEGNGAEKASIFGPALDFRSEMKPRITVVELVFSWPIIIS